MDRDKGLRRTTAITGVLVAASLAGTLAVGLAARAAETAETGSSSNTAPESSTTTDNNARQRKRQRRPGNLGRLVTCR
jgi:hypothetical protein